MHTLCPPSSCMAQHLVSYSSVSPSQVLLLACLCAVEKHGSMQDGMLVGSVPRLELHLHSLRLASKLLVTCSLPSFALQLTGKARC